MLETIIVVLFFAASNSLLTHFLDFCLGDFTTGKINPKRIFSRVGYFLKEKYDAWELRENERLNQFIFSNDDLAKVDRLRRVNPWKAIGVCPICFNVWLGIGSGLLLISGDFFSYWYLLPYIVISNFIVRAIYRMI